MKFLALLIWAVSGQALTHSPAFTIQGAVQRALERNPDVLKSQEAINQSGANYSLSIAKLFPSLNGTLEASHLKAASASSSPAFRGNAYNQYLVSLNLEQPVYNGGLFAGFSYGKKDTVIKQYQLEIAQRTLTQAVLENFYSILLNEELLRILQNTLKSQKESLAKAESYARVGRMQRVDVLQLRTQVALLAPKIAQVDSQLRISAAQLAGLLRDLDADQIRLKGFLSSPPADWVRKTLGKRSAVLPEVKQIREQILQFEDTRDIQMATYWLKLSLLGKASRSVNRNSDLFDANYTAWNLTLQLSVPIFAGLSSVYLKDSLSSQQRQLELDEMKVNDTVSISQIQTERALEVAETQLESSKQAAVYGRETLKEAERSFRFQTINYLQYQSAHQTYLDSESTYATAKYNFIIAIAKYFNAVGVPPATLVEKLDELSGKLPPSQE